MNPVSSRRHRFSSAVVVQAMRRHFRFTHSTRDVQELIIRVSHGAILCWAIKFGLLIAAM